MNVSEYADGAARPGAIRVMQFGEGNFLRAFADMMFDEYNRERNGDLGVAIVQPLKTGMTDAIREQNGLYTVILRGRENGRNVFRPRVVTCVTDALNPYEEWQRYLDLARIDTLRLIVSNTTEAGIVYTGGDAFSDAPPSSYPGKLTRFLYERFSLGMKGFILMPCELIDDNGRKLREAVLQTAAQWALGESFIQWIQTENIFCSTLVDRIVTGFPRDEKDALYDKLGYTDKLLDVAEPFGLWVIEAPQSVREEFPLDECNPVLYTDDVKPYKLRKVRMLNGAHTTIVLASYLIGLKTVGECMKDEDARAFLGHALVDEIMPNVPLPRDEVNQFAADVCARFENPFNRHELLSIALNSVSKWTSRVLPTLEDYVKANGRAPRCLTFGLSALIMFYADCKKGADGTWRGAVNGEKYPVRDDEEALISFSRLSPDMPPESLAYAVLSDQMLWGRDLRGIPTLEETVTEQLRDMQLLGVRAAMRKTWSDGHDDEAMIRLNPADNVAVLLKPRGDIPAGHKIALGAIPPGGDIIKYGHRIGRASAAIAAGEWVHSHNLQTALAGETAYAYRPVRFPDAAPWTGEFMGFAREDGSVGVRNEIWILPSVGCVNRIAETIAARARDRFGAPVYAFTHPYGCSQLGDDLDNTRNLLCALARHPNAGGALILGLGCENNGVEGMRALLGDRGGRARYLIAQQAEDEIEDGLRLVGELLGITRNDRRTPQPLSKLVIGLKCGGSDGFSGITANPLLGCLSDSLCAGGGSALLTEVPEMFGAEQSLLSRCENEEVFRKTAALVNGFKAYYIRSGQPVCENPSPGNKAGGITTLEEKSLGCTEKGGLSPVRDVLDYASPARKSGLSLVWGPGNDLCAVTALAGAGAQLILFTTGRGTPFGSPVPTIKVSTNSALAEKKPHWIDFDAGRLLTGESMDALTDALKSLVLKTADGEETCAERAGDRGIAIFKSGVTL